MNGCSKRSLSPWSAELDDAASELSGSVDDYCRIPYLRMRENGTYEKNTILKKIYKDMGFLSTAYKKINPQTYTKSSFPRHPRRTKAENHLRKYEPYKSKGTPRYSRIDKFIEGLDQACAALPKPLMEDFCRVRPHAVAVQSHPKKEVRRIQVHGVEPDFSTSVIIAEQREEDLEQPECPIESGALTEKVDVQINKSKSPEMGTWRVADECNRDCERQAVKRSTDESPFERKKMELVRAATMLQSRYRGHKVRRSQPLKYMHMIGNAKTKLEELKQEFSTWKIAPGFPTDYAERLSMTQNVMNLLMKLESIQGVPLYIREFRKSVAREVAKFQEEVDAFLRHNTKHGPLFELMRKGNNRRQNSQTETNKPDLSGNRSNNLSPDMSTTEELPTEPNTDSRPTEELADAPTSVEPEDCNECEPEDSDLYSDRLVADIVAPECPEEIIPLREDSLVSPEPSLKNQNVPPSPSVQPFLESEIGAKNETSRDESDQCETIGAGYHDNYIPSRNNSSRKLRKKAYAVRFQDEVNIVSRIEAVESPNEDFSSLDAAGLKKYNHQCPPVSRFDGTERKQSTDMNQPHDEAYSQVSAAKSEVGDHKGPPTSCSSVIIPAHRCEPNTEELHPVEQKEPSFGDYREDRRLKHQSLPAGALNSSANKLESFRQVTVPSKSRFCTEQSQLRATSYHDPIRQGYEGSSYDGEVVQEHDRITEVQAGARRGNVKVPALDLSLEQRQKVAFAGDELRQVLRSPRIRRSGDEFQSVRLSPRKVSDEVRNEGNVESIRAPAMESVSCCSDCAQPRGHYPYECWKSRPRSEEERRPRHNAYTGHQVEVQEEYGSGDYFRPRGNEEFSGFDHRELRYAADPYTLKIRRARQVTEITAANDEQLVYQKQNRLPPRPPPPPTAVQVQQQIPKVYAHKTTSYTPSPPDSICSEAERAYQKNMSQVPYRQTVVPEERRAWESEESGQGSEQELVTKLADDNKRLKGLLKDVMHWNKAQATAMVSMSERIEHLEGLDKLP
ncbi:hypothetical protein R1flu_002913 [Riccia fluitans]|uniref:BAG domain-containing protein n=1 Tax=Riccia fluitans TaxID=41844 RepID=A0ABD1Y7G8_9MARC